MTARFKPRGWLPEQARVAAESIRLPAEVARLEGFEDLSGAFVFEWRDDRFKLDASAHAEPKRDAKRGLPPVALTLLARGDQEAVAIEKLNLTAPGIRADLSDSFAVTRSGKLLTDAASLKVSVDLSKVPWVSMRGMLEGLVRIRPDETNSLRAIFDLAGAGLSREGVEIQQADLAGELNWPVLRLRRVDAKLADASTLAGGADLNLQSRALSDGRWRFQGRLPRAWLPDGLSYSTVQTTGQFRGPLIQPIHSGQFIVRGLSLASFRSNLYEVRASWRGEKLDLSGAQIEITAGSSMLSLAGAVRLAAAKGQSSTVTLQTLNYQQKTQLIYSLQSPCAVSFRRNNAAPNGWDLKIGMFRWTGPQRAISLSGEAEWPRHGRVRIGCQGVALDDFVDFLPVRGCVVSNLDFAAKWDRGPVDFELSSHVGLMMKESSPFSAEVSLRANAGGCEVQRLAVSDRSGAVVSAQGTIPVAFVPGHPNGWLIWDETKTINLRATTEPNKSFWDGLARLTSVRVSNPTLDLAIRGPLAQPQGRLRLEADGLEWKSTTNRLSLPRTENLKAEIDFKRDRLDLKTFTVDVEGQPIRVRGELPLRKMFWTELLTKGELPDWRQASGRVEVVDARCALFAKYLPDVLSTRGRFSLDVGIQPGARVDGELQITNAATRPLAPVGQIHDISARIELVDRGARIEQFAGQIGGQSVSLTGRVSLVDKRAIEFEAGLHGKNVPLVREPGVLLRSDVDVQLTQKAGQPAVLSGKATLRDSLFLQDLKSLVPVGPAQQSERPPYFSVDEQPFADWRLNLQIHGDKFMRIRTPLFRGEISADFRLTGSMREPLALGEVRLGSGRIQFPFGTLAIEQGYVTLTSENPYRPRLFVIASGRNYGYTVKLEMSGPADEPRLTFTSTPPLSSEQIVLMLTAGDLPQAEITFSNQERATRLAMFLGKDFLSRLVGDEAAAERLMIRSGENVSDEGKLTYYLEYRLTEKWWVTGEYDRFNALNAGLKWKIFSK
jgi:translocation and assembly module TamB